MLNAVKSVLADVSSVSPSSELRQHIHINLTLIHCTFYCHADADQNHFSQGQVFHCILNVGKLFNHLVFRTGFISVLTSSSPQCPCGDVIIRVSYDVNNLKGHPQSFLEIVEFYHSRRIFEVFGRKVPTLVSYGL